MYTKNWCTVTSTNLIHIIYLLFTNIKLNSLDLLRQFNLRPAYKKLLKRTRCWRPPFQFYELTPWFRRVGIEVLRGTGDEEAMMYTSPT